MRRFLLIALVWLVCAAGPALAQEPLTLAEAVASARAANPAIRVARAAEAEAATRVRQATAAWLPRVDFTEGWQRGNMPVYVFGSLLSQQRFTEANFAIDSLNRPDALTNHRAALSFTQPLFSADVISSRRAAGLSAELASAGRDAIERDLTLDATTRFGEALAAQAGVGAAESAVQSAEDDLRRTKDRRDAGLVTDADVLSVEVHLAHVRARAIDARAQARIALAALNRVMGSPLDREYVLAAAAPGARHSIAGDRLETEAIAARPESRSANLGERLARVQRDAARHALLPQVVWQGGYEWNGVTFAERAGSWMLGVEARLNLFRGFADRARLAETAHGLERARAEREAVDAAIRLQVRTAALQLEAARARLDVGLAAVAQARDSQRIIRDRYENGLVGVGEVLRAAQALLEAESQHTAAEADVITRAAALDRAVGR